MRGWVNPLLSRTHAAPVQHCFAQNTSVRFCSGARQRGWQQTRKPVIHTHTHVQTHMGHVTSVCRLSSVHPVSNLITARSVTGVGVGSLSQSALKQEQELCFLTPCVTDLKLIQLFEQEICDSRSSKRASRNRSMPCTDLTRCSKRFQYAEVEQPKFCFLT